MHWMLFTANVVPSSSILVTLIIEALGSSDTSVLRRATWRNIPEDGFLLVSYLFAFICVLNEVISESGFLSKTKWLSL
jgi:hypothetical protein